MLKYFLYDSFGEHMPHKLTQLLNLFLFSLVLTSCAGIKHKNAVSPTKAIRDFSAETQTQDKTNAENFLTQKDTKLLKHWTKYFTGAGKMGFQTFLNNGEKYKPMIQEIFRSHNLPESLYYVGLIESGYIVRARSHAKAVGPWQFIRETGQRYGLRVNNKIDERQNIYKSTQAAALYFQDLYNIFGSWELALSAYNAGEYGIIRRIRGANTRDFYRLSKMKVLPRETRNYVPKVLAAMNVAKEARRHDIKIKKLSSKNYSSAIPYRVNNKITLKNLSNHLKVSSHTIKQLNADIKGNHIPHMGKKGFYVYLPKDRKYSASLPRATFSNPRKKKSRSIRKVATASKINKPAQKHIVRANESLSSISKKYNVTIRSIKKINRLKNSTIYLGQSLKLPTLFTKANHFYTVKKGDHLSKIANRFKVRAKRIKTLNKLNKSKIFIGQKLKVPAHTKTYHVVKKGEALIRIAKQYRTKLDKLKDLNNFKNPRIYPGQKILVKLTPLSGS